MKKIQQKITSVKLLSMGKDTDRNKEDVVKEFIPTVVLDVERPEELHGSTYKIKAPNAKAATYVTVNNLVLDVDTTEERIVPYEMFIKSKDVSHQQFTDIIGRIISAAFREGRDCKFLLDEFLETTDPAGGGYMRKGGYIKGLVAEIGMVVKAHVVRLDELNKRIDNIAQIKAELKPVDDTDEETLTFGDLEKLDNPDGQYGFATGTALGVDESHKDFLTMAGVSDKLMPMSSPWPKNSDTCKECGQRAFIVVEGCGSCAACGYSGCG